MTVLLMLLLPITLLLALIWLLFRHRDSKTDLTAAALDIKKFLPNHCRHFPQVRSILNTADQEFMVRRAPRHLVNRWRTQRHQILRLYLRSLARDFRGLEQLARLIAALSPEITRKQEWEWLWLGLQFRLLYRMTLLHFALRRLPPSELVRLTELLTSLASALEHSIEQMTQALPQVETTASS